MMHLSALSNQNATNNLLANEILSELVLSTEALASSNNAPPVPKPPRGGGSNAHMDAVRRRLRPRCDAIIA